MNSFRQTAVGIFVLLGLVCVAYLTIKLGKMEVFDSKGFELVANFNSVSGLRARRYHRLGQDQRSYR